MVFHTRQKQINTFSFLINGKEVENVPYFKFLGILLDESLTWKNHIKMVCNKLSKIVGILNRLKRIYPQQALLSIYNSLFMSHINYGLLLWGAQTESVFKPQKNAIRIISGSEYLAHTEPLLKTISVKNC